MQVWKQNHQLQGGEEVIIVKWTSLIVQSFQNNAKQFRFHCLAVEEGTQEEIFEL